MNHAPQVTPEPPPPADRIALLRALIAETEALLDAAPWEDIAVLRDGLERRQKLIDAATAAPPVSPGRRVALESLLARMKDLDRALTQALERDRLDTAERLSSLRRSRRGIRGYGSGTPKNARYFDESV